MFGQENDGINRSMGIRQSNPRPTNNPSNRGDDTALRSFSQLPRGGRIPQDYDFFADPHELHKQGELHEPQDEYSMLQGGGKSIRPPFEPSPELKLLAEKLDKAERRIEIMSDENKKLLIDNKYLQQKKEEADSARKSMQERLAQDLAEKEKNYKEYTELIDTNARENLQAAEATHA